MKIRLKREIRGMFHGHDGVRVGDVIEVDDLHGARYCKLHYAEPVVDRQEERAVAPRGEERAAKPAAKAQESK